MEAWVAPVAVVGAGAVAEASAAAADGAAGVVGHAAVVVVGSARCEAEVGREGAVHHVGAEVGHILHGEASRGAVVELVVHG